MSAIVPVIKYLSKDESTKKLARDMQTEYEAMQAVIAAARELPHGLWDIEIDGCNYTLVIPENLDAVHAALEKLEGNKK